MRGRVASIDLLGRPLMGQPILARFVNALWGLHTLRSPCQAFHFTPTEIYWCQLQTWTTHPTKNKCVVLNCGIVLICQVLGVIKSRQRVIELLTIATAAFQQSMMWLGANMSSIRWLISQEREKRASCSFLLTVMASRIMRSALAQLKKS